LLYYKRCAKRVSSARWHILLYRVLLIEPCPMHAKFRMSETPTASVSRIEVRQSSSSQPTRVLQVALLLLLTCSIFKFFRLGYSTLPSAGHSETFATAIILHQTNFCAKTRQHRPNPAGREEIQRQYSELENCNHLSPKWALHSSKTQ
jgi:hypothetical protein